MDNPIGDDVRSGRANRRLGLFDEVPGMSDATLVLLRIENDGSQSIADNDYTGRELHGLTAVFTDRTIRGVSVTQPVGTDHLMDHFTPAAGLGYDGSTLRIPRVPLNRGDHFKLLVLLSGGDVGCPIRLIGGIRDGEVHPNRSATPDETLPLFSRASRLITVMLTLCVVTLAAIVVVRDDNPHPRPHPVLDPGGPEALRVAHAARLSSPHLASPHLGSGGRCRGMFGRLPPPPGPPGPGGCGNLPWTTVPSCRLPGTTADWMPSGPDPVRNSTIQSAVSTRTSSVTSSEKRRSTPRHRSAASLAVPSAGPRNSRTPSDAQSNWSA